MAAVLSISWDIALWRRSPRDLPASLPLLGLVALAYLLGGIVQASLIYHPAFALERSLADLALTVVVFCACLALRGRSNRAVQTLTAVLSTSVLITLPIIAVLWLSEAVARDARLALAIKFGMLPLQIWYVFVLGRIVRLALDSTLTAGMAVALTYFMLSDALQTLLPRVLAA